MTKPVAGSTSSPVAASERFAPVSPAVAPVSPDRYAGTAASAKPSSRAVKYPFADTRDALAARGQAIRDALDNVAYEKSQSTEERYTDPELGRYGCALAVWNLLKDALHRASPDDLYPKALAFEKACGGKVTSTANLLKFYKTYGLGFVAERVSLADLDASAIPAGSIVIGHKKGGKDHHVLVAADIEGRWRELYADRYETKNGSYERVAHDYVGTISEMFPDGRADVFIGNTGLSFAEAQGKPHVRAQEFATTHDGMLARLNTHHGAINAPGPNQPYEAFTVLTFTQNAVDLTIAP